MMRALTILISIAAAVIGTSPAFACDGLPGQLFFDGDSTVLSDDANRVLDDYARRVQDTPSIGLIEIQGHTDSLGDAEANQRLSEMRAERVRDALFARGVPARLVKTVGYGETHSAVDAGDGTREPRNSRVVLRDDGARPACILTMPPPASEAQ
jgi:outer membrane protein OmpA-like peptidoglycan-associated protein